MDDYAPPFEITNLMLERVSSIMKKIGKIDNYNDLNKMPILRKNNRIKSIHSSLAIEANSLSFNEVKDVIDGKVVFGTQKEIQEVKNAYNAYEMMMDINPYSINDLKKVHGIMMNLIINQSGKFRNTNEGVFDENGKCIHMCPPPEHVNDLIKKLFKWMKGNKDNIHPLILSSIFHYEFVFIHPFQDGNGRMARLWQNIILSNWEEIFLYIPIESEIMKYQNEYYISINNCNASGNSTLFIEFMLKMIDDVLSKVVMNVSNQINYNNNYIARLLDVMDFGALYTTKELMNLLNMKSRDSFRKNYLLPSIEKNLIKMSLPNTPTSKNQAYYKQ